VDGLKSPAGWLPVHRDQLRAQRKYGITLLFTITIWIGGHKVMTSKALYCWNWRTSHGHSSHVYCKTISETMQDGDTFTNTDLSNRNNYSDLEGHSHIAILFKWEFVRNTMRVTQRVARFSRQQPNLLLLGLHIYKILLFFFWTKYTSEKVCCRCCCCCDRNWWYTRILSDCNAFKAFLVRHPVV